jgi:hypothetical protein
MVAQARLRPSKRFSYFPLPFAFFLPTLLPVILLVLILVGRVKDPSGLAALALYALLGIIAVVAWLVGLSYWRRPWGYETHEDRLVAYRLWGRHRIDLPWGEIIRVSRVTGKDWRRNWPETLLESRSGTRVVIPSNLGGYKELIEAIRDRAKNCREFDVYPSWRFGARPDESNSTPAS